MVSHHFLWPSPPCLHTILRNIPSSLCVFTSATEGAGGYVFTPFLSVCLSLCRGYHKKLLTDPDEIFWIGWVCDTDELIRFWWKSGSGSDYENFLSDFSPLRDRAKLIYSTISQKSCGWIRMKLGEQVWCVTMTNCFDFGEDPTTRIFIVILHHWEIGLKNDI